ncbi:MAG: hypothetical protein M0017_05630 [Desulfobacteraceae bacterium]|nr:hypothetical protein [Desulfobacteraceae bacterium]
MPSQEKREEATAPGQEAVCCDQCGRPEADMAWERGLWLCAACREELDSCGCSD